jgi:proteasome assembly chaperone (PAC2) family protein
VSNNFDETFPRPQAGPFGVVREDGDQERVTVLVAAFEGWNDAGDAATDAVQFLAGHYGAKDVFEVTSDDYYDYQFSRPLVRRGATGDVKIVWPTTRLSTATVPGTNLDLVLLHGWEPSYRWRSFTAELLEQATLLDVDFVVMVGALLADVPHTRPIPVTKTSDTAELQDELGIDSSQYEGPTGIVGLLSHMASLGGFPTVSLWAAVPHYVAAAPNPKAALALVRKIESLVAVTVDASELETATEDYERQVGLAVQSDPDVQAFVERLEQAAERDTTPLGPGDLPSGDAIASEFQRFLRQQGPER